MPKLIKYTFEIVFIFDINYKFHGHADVKGLVLQNSTTDSFSARG